MSEFSQGAIVWAGPTQRSAGRRCSQGLASWSNKDFGSFRSDALGRRKHLHMLLQVAASFQWVVSVFDVDAAFLNRVPLERELCVRLSLDLRAQDGLWALLKAVSLLTEAPPHWWLRVRQGLLEMDWHEAPCAPETFAFYDGDSLMGLLVLRVDDGLIGGDGAALEQAMQLRGRAALDKRRNNSCWTGTARRLWAPRWRRVNLYNSARVGRKALVAGAGVIAGVELRRLRAPAVGQHSGELRGRSRVSGVLPKCGSLARCISLVTQADVMSPLVPACIVMWRSMRVKRVVTSTSEAAARPAAQDRGDSNRALLAYMSGNMGARKRQPWVLGTRLVPGMLAIGARSLSDLLAKQGSHPKGRSELRLTSSRRAMAWRGRPTPCSGCPLVGFSPTR